MKLKTILLSMLLSCALSEASAQLPAVALKDIDGRNVNTATLSNNGKPFLISFFATWCKPCNRELDAIHDLYPDWQEETDVKLIAVSIDEAQNMQKVKPMVHAAGWEFEVLLDPNGDFKRALGVSMIPHVLVIDGNGKIAGQHKGYTEGAEGELIEKVRELLHEK